MMDHEVQLKQYELLKREFIRAKAYACEYLGENGLSHFYNTRIRRVSELLRGFRQGRILDIGCGPAVVGNIFRGKPIEYHGVDISEAMLEVCRESFSGNPQFAFSLQEIESLGFADASFDVVLCLGILEYVIDEHAAIREVTRVLKPNGILIATMLNKFSPYQLWLDFVYTKWFNATLRLGKLFSRAGNARKKNKAPDSQKPSSLLLRERTFRELLTSEGLRIEDVLYYDFAVIPAPLDGLFPRMSVRLKRNLEFLCRSKLKLIGRGYMAKCRKALGEPLERMVGTALRPCRPAGGESREAVKMG